VGASEAGRANLTKTILLLEKAIEDHNDAVHLNEGMARITVIERLLRWPSAVDNSPKVRAAGGHGSLVVRRLSGIHPVNTFTRTGGWPAVAVRYDVSHVASASIPPSPSLFLARHHPSPAACLCCNHQAYVSPAHQKLLSFRPNVQLQSLGFCLDAPTQGGRRIKRACSYEGLLTTVHRSGKPLKRLWAYLIDDLFILAKSDAKAWSMAEAGGCGPGDPMVQSLLHVSDIKVLDVPDEPPLITNCFTVLVLDGFGNPDHFFTFRTESRFEKADWMRRLM